MVAGMNNLIGHILLVMDVVEIPRGSEQSKITGWIGWMSQQKWKNGPNGTY